MDDVDNSTDAYRIKDIVFFGSPRRILLQSRNGPCPLLALCNVLLLRNQLRISMDARYIAFDELVQLVSNHMFDANAAAASGDDGTGSRAANVRENLGSCLDILPKLNVGLDVNCKFGGPRDFEYTRELTVFDLCDLNLFHGWVASRQDQNAYKVLGHLSYNQAVEKLIAYEEERQKKPAEGQPPPASQENTAILEEGVIIKDFMDRTASQLSYEGLLELQQAVRERELAVFFRNSHFSTLLKYNGTLYLLCTDIAFGASEIVWERLDELDGNTEYCNADFKEHVEVPPEMNSAEQAEETAIAAAAAGDDEAALRVEQGAMDAMIAWQMQQEEQIQADYQEAQMLQGQVARAAQAPQPRPLPTPAPAPEPAPAAAGTGSAGVATSATPAGQASAAKGKKKPNRTCVLQ